MIAWDRGVRWTTGLVLAIAVVSWSCAAAAQDEVKSGQTENDPVARNPLRRHALIVIGLPGDHEHRERFEKTAEIWREWLIKVARVNENDLTILQGSGSDDSGSDDADRAATQESVRRLTAQLSSQIGPEESLWVFLLGHGSQDQRHGWFHLPGPDMNAAQWAGRFSELKAGEQVFWLTHSASGRFLKPFSLPGRIVIAATDDGEINETRFPDALAAVMQKQIKREGEDSAEMNQPVSLLELFRFASEKVRQSFDEEKLLPTEHAQLDDNGDGVGTETTDFAQLAPLPQDAGAAQAVVDGMRAAQITVIAAKNLESQRESSVPTTTPPQ